jgi:hypothetical protein
MAFHTSRDNDKLIAATPTPATPPPPPLRRVTCSIYWQKETRQLGEVMKEVEEVMKEVEKECLLRHHHHHFAH